MASANPTYTRAPIPAHRFRARAIGGPGRNHIMQPVVVRLDNDPMSTGGTDDCHGNEFSLVDSRTRMCFLAGNNTVAQYVWSSQIQPSKIAQNDPNTSKYVDQQFRLDNMYVHDAPIVTIDAISDSFGSCFLAVATEAGQLSIHCIGRDHPLSLKANTFALPGLPSKIKFCMPRRLLILCKSSALGRPQQLIMVTLPVDTVTTPEFIEVPIGQSFDASVDHIVDFDVDHSRNGYLASVLCTDGSIFVSSFSSVASDAQDKKSNSNVAFDIDGRDTHKCALVFEKLLSFSSLAGSATAFIRVSAVAQEVYVISSSVLFIANLLDSSTEDLHIVKQAVNAAFSTDAKRFIVIDNTGGISVAYRKEGHYASLKAIEWITPDKSAAHIYNSSCLDENLFVLVLKDGVVLVFDVDSCTVAFRLPNAHLQSVFDVAFNPASKDQLASCSQDGFVRLWDSLNLLPVRTIALPGSPCIYSLAWHPFSSLLAVSVADGLVFILNTASGLILHVFNHHTKASCSVSWNQHASKMLASTSIDGYAVVFTEDGKQLKRYFHPAAVYGCEWSPFGSSILATACDDGIVRIFDTSLAELKPVTLLQGHTARVFSVAWSPLLSGCIASGSDDRTIRVWDVSLQSNVVLRGHSENVRGLEWNKELPHILLSSSWDATIRAWDVRMQQCVMISTDHHADIFALATHHERPFLIASCGRDATVRTFSIHDSFVQRHLVQAVIRNGRLSPSSIDSVENCLDPGHPIKLVGAASKRLVEHAADMSDLAAYRALFDFFAPQAGICDVFDLLEAIIAGVPAPDTCSLPLIQDMRTSRLAFAKALEVASNADNDPTLLDQASNIYLELGCIRDYCNVLVRRGRWELALAVAPAAGIAFWKHFVTEHAHLQQQQNTALAVPLLMAAGEISALVSLESTRRQFDAAINIASAGAAGFCPQYSDLEEIQPVVDAFDRDTLPIDNTVRFAAEMQCVDLIENGNNIRAAVLQLSLSSPEKATEQLLLGGEQLLALSLVFILKLDGYDHIIRQMIYDAMQLQLVDDSIKLTIRTFPDSKNLLCTIAQFFGAYDSRKDLHDRYGIESPEKLAIAAKAHANEGKYTESTVEYLASGAVESAAITGINGLRELVSSASSSAWNLEQIRELLQPLEFLPLEQLGAELRNEIIAWSYFGATQIAATHRFAHIIPFLYERLRVQVLKISNFPLSSASLKLMEATAMMPFNSNAARMAVQQALSDISLSVKDKAHATSLKKQLDALAGGMHFEQKGKSIYSSQCNLPLAQNFRGRSSLISKAPLLCGTTVQLDSNTVLSLSDLYTLRVCTPFSPLLNGQRLPLFL